MENLPADLLPLLKEYNLDGRIEIEGFYSEGVSDSVKEQDLRMAKSFIFPHPRKPRIIKIEGSPYTSEFKGSPYTSEFNHNYREIINFHLSNHSILECKAEGYRSEYTNFRGISLVLLNPKDGSEIDLLNGIDIEISRTSLIYMLGESITSRHYVQPLMRVLTIMYSILATNLKEVLKNQGYLIKNGK